jgi:hypothetical protein
MYVKHHRLRPSVAAIVIGVLLALRMIVLGEAYQKVLQK